MGTVRLTFEGAYHHVISRGIKGEDIFSDDKAKDFLLKLLKEKSRKLGIKIIAYCIMDNHYHLILQNASGRLSSFMRQLNGQYGIYYRSRVGGSGYVFQGRYKSILIQKDDYLSVVIVYVLLNPVRAGIEENPYNYSWSSINEYFKNDNSDIVDNKFTEELLGSEIILEELLLEWVGKDIEITKTRMGKVIGDIDFIEEVKRNFNRRKVNARSKRRRKDDYILKNAEDVIKGFEKEKGVSVEEIDSNSITGKRLRGELLVLLKDRAGLKYTEIIEYPLFRSLKHSSLGSLYKRARERVYKE